jgi:hypothetical protein
MSLERASDTEAATWIAGAIIVLMLLLCLGCTWGAGERLAYDSVAREQIDKEIAAKSRLIVCELADMKGQVPRPGASVIDSRAREIGELAAQGIQRARIAQLYYGAQSKDIILGNGKDQAEVMGLAGIAAQKNARRLWWSRLPQSIVDQVTAFAISFAKAIVVEVPKALVPAWVWWALSIAFVIALGIGLFALYRYLIDQRTIKDFWQGVESMPSYIRKLIGQGRPYLEIAHKKLNEEQKRQRREDEAEKRRRFADALRTLADSKQLDAADGTDFFAQVPIDQQAPTGNTPTGQEGH